MKIFCLQIVRLSLNCEEIFLKELVDKARMGNELSQHIDNSQKTGVLQLRSFKLAKVPVEVEQVGQFLRNLDLSNNRIQILPATLFLKMNSLKTLNLSANKIGK